MLLSTTVYCGFRARSLFSRSNWNQRCSSGDWCRSARLAVVRGVAIHRICVCFSGSRCLRWVLIAAQRPSNAAEVLALAISAVFVTPGWFSPEFSPSCRNPLGQSRNRRQQRPEICRGGDRGAGGDIYLATAKPAPLLDGL